MSLVQTHNLDSIIMTIRGKKVLIDRDLAHLYDVETKYLNLQVRRNLNRFPEEFMFRLDPAETAELVTNCHRFKSLRHSSSPPYAFTEYGVAMLSSVLNSRVAVKASILIIKAFIRMRSMTVQYSEFAKKLSQLESKTDKHDEEIQIILRTLRDMLAHSEKPKRQIGFHVKE